jgi:hypothetical protein
LDLAAGTIGLRWLLRNLKFCSKRYIIKSRPNRLPNILNSVLRIQDGSEDNPKLPPKIRKLLGGSEGSPEEQRMMVLQNTKLGSKDNL